MSSYKRKGMEVAVEKFRLAFLLYLFYRNKAWAKIRLTIPKPRCFAVLKNAV